MMKSNSNKPSPKRCLKAGKAANYMDISVRTLHDLTASGRLPFHKVSERTHLFDIRDLDAFLDSCRIGGELCT